MCKTRGPKLAPRRRLNRHFPAALKKSGMRVWYLARLAGFPHTQTLSHILHADVVRASPLTVERITCLADIIDFPRDQVFADGPSEDGVGE